MTRIALAQIQSKPGDVRWNVQHHLDFCELAKRHHAELICFPELSITNYEPGLASTYRMELDDPGLEELRSFSHKNNLIICIGAPRPTPAGLLISLYIFRPDGHHEVYSKQQLHDDELPYFVPGNQEVIINVEDHDILPAICYESLQSSFMDSRMKPHINLILASVSKPQRGIERAYPSYSNLAKKHGVPVLMVNGIGEADNFMAAGQSGVWDASGECVARLSNDQEQMLIFDSGSHTTTTLSIEARPSS